MSFGLQRVVPGTWSRDGHVLPPSWERACLVKGMCCSSPYHHGTILRGKADQKRLTLPGAADKPGCPFRLCFPRKRGRPHGK